MCATPSSACAGAPGNWSSLGTGRHADALFRNRWHYVFELLRRSAHLSTLGAGVGRVRGGSRAAVRGVRAVREGALDREPTRPALSMAEDGTVCAVGLLFRQKASG